MLNTDQSELELEILSTRTLSHRSEKTTLVMVCSINLTFHNYMVQPTLNLSGMILNSIYLCLKERINGRMSKNLERNR